LFEQVLRKQPELQCCRVLKSLALLRLGKEQEAEAILDKVNRQPRGLNQDSAKSKGLDQCFGSGLDPDPDTEVQKVPIKIGKN
jgi:hypothetical protein